MAKYIDAVECADIISQKYNIPLAELVDVFAEIPAADVVSKLEHWRLQGEVDRLTRIKNAYYLRYGTLIGDADK